ncbi:hypothetical protein FIBSPDRAFT_459724 [Athelia psychrophila]|uniref:Uncharacterized protein n=1 Tax=Athelia psychrophila TaxID=1759441 RepID=A0A166LSM9_9AGAM|nr:hypothetical protein FIBSPDRAFT_459724 [Fibularhizoctonia sp. CBS 109695]
MSALPAPALDRKYLARGVTRAGVASHCQRPQLEAAHVMVVVVGFCLFLRRLMEVLTVFRCLCLFFVFQMTTLWYLKQTRITKCPQSCRALGHSYLLHGPLSTWPIM